MSKETPRPRKYAPITDEVIALVCKDLETGLTMAQTCQYHGLSLSYMHQIEAQKTRFKAGSRHEAWRASISRARVRAVSFWMDRLRSVDLSNAGVKAAEFMLSALEPDRFREKRDASGIVVHIIQGGGGAPRELTATVVGETAPDAPGGVLGLSLPIVDADAQEQPHEQQQTGEQISDL